MNINTHRNIKIGKKKRFPQSARNNAHVTHISSTPPPGLDPSHTWRLNLVAAPWFQS